jgi:hypothetical protein
MAQPRKVASPKARKRKTGKQPSRTATTRRRAAETTRARKAGTSRNTADSAKRRWSKRVTEHSDALDLKQGVFKLRDPKKIATSLKRSAEHSSRRKANPYRSALSMLTFYINRAGANLPKTQRTRLDKAKDELRRLFHRDA